MLETSKTFTIEQDMYALMSADLAFGNWLSTVDWNVDFARRVEHFRKYKQIAQPTFPTECFPPPIDFESILSIKAPLPSPYLEAYYFQLGVDGNVVE